MTRPLRIAVADDDRRMRAYLRKTLPHLGHEVVCAVQSGRELIERALPFQLQAETSYELGPDGVRCAITLPISTQHGMPEHA